MSSHSSTYTSSQKSIKYDDWICLMCHNLNYSFRKTCNRCHSQTKQNNDYLMQFYQSKQYNEQLRFDNEKNLQNQNKISNETYGESSFPSCLFLLLHLDQDEINLVKRQSWQQDENKWVECLISD